MRDRQIIRIFRYTGLVFILIAVIYLILSQAENKWFYILIGWVIFISATAIYRYSIYRAVQINFNKVLKQTGGSIEKGNYFFGAPHKIKFIYIGKICQIGYSISSKLDYMIEYTCSTSKELELRIIRRSHKLLKKEMPLTKNIILNKAHFAKRFIVIGENKDLIDIFLKDPTITRLIEQLMQDFNYLYFGKDSRMRVLGYYDIYFTEPEVVFSTFHKMIRLIDCLENEI